MEFRGFSEETTICYFSIRRFKVYIKNTFSNPGNFLCEVPQGSNLRPLLFLLYINDMLQGVECELLLYANDTVSCFNVKISSKLKRH